MFFFSFASFETFNIQHSVYRSKSNLVGYVNDFLVKLYIQLYDPTKGKSYQICNNTINLMWFLSCSFQFFKKINPFEFSMKNGDKCAELTMCVWWHWRKSNKLFGRFPINSSDKRPKHIVIRNAKSMRFKILKCLNSLEIYSN